MNPDLQRDLMSALERPHRLGTIGGNLEDQLAHCASFSSVLGQVVQADKSDFGANGIDLGTGGGLPGIALAALHPKMAWTLVDMRAARADEVERTILGLRYQDRVEVIAAEAQHVGHQPKYREQFDIAVARAFGPPSVTAECAAGVLVVGGVFIVSEPPHRGGDVDRWNEAGLTTLGFGKPVPKTADGQHFMTMTKVAPTPDNFPRLPPRSTRGWS